MEQFILYIKDNFNCIEYGNEITFDKIKPPSNYEYPNNAVTTISIDTENKTFTLTFCYEYDGQCIKMRLVEYDDDYSGPFTELEIDDGLFIKSDFYIPFDIDENKLKEDDGMWIYSDIYELNQTNINVLKKWIEM